MNDEPRDDERAEEADDPTGEAGASAPPPATWAGRKRAGDESGITEEFDHLEAELADDLSDGTAEFDLADEAEEPPDEFAFDEAVEDEDEEEETAFAEGEDELDRSGDEAGDEEPEAEAEADEPDSEEALVPAGQETVEADTIAAANEEARSEAERRAHEGLRARAERARTAAGAAAVAAAPGSAQAAVTASHAAGEAPKRTVWWRFFAASFVIVAAVATATAVSFLLYLTDIGDALGDEGFSASVAPSLSEVKGGEPQTILILGSDKRGTPGDPGRSDTTMLLRVDPQKEFLALLSLPRDLEVQIPGYGTDKLNAAYSLGEQFDAKGGGGPQLTLRTVKELLGIDINHIVNVDFSGFYDAINAIGCVYVDIDRHYYNPVGGEYDDIDIKAGYTKLCGYRALDYVRYRHTDNDLVRGARQQAFVREARQQIPPRDLLPPPFGDADLIDIFTKHTTSDINNAPTIIEMLRSFVSVRDASVRQVSLGSITMDGGVEATKAEVRAALTEFLGRDLRETSDDAAGADGGTAKPRENKKKRKASGGESPGPALVDVAGTTQEYARDFDTWLKRKNARLPVMYPTQVVANSNAAITPESRAHKIEPPAGVKKPYLGYKFVATYQEGFGTSYYGVAGVNWPDAPILNNPSETRTIDGHEYLLFYERDRLRMVGWKTNRAAYWVQNTLTRTLSEAEMLAVAESVRSY